MDDQLLQNIMIKLTEIDTKVSQLLDKQGDHEERIRALEAKPGKRWESVTMELIIALLIGAASYAFGKLT